MKINIFAISAIAALSLTAFNSFPAISQPPRLQRANPLPFTGFNRCQLMSFPEQPCIMRSYYRGGVKIHEFRWQDGSISLLSVLPHTEEINGKYYTVIAFTHVKGARVIFDVIKTYAGVTNEWTCLFADYRVGDPRIACFGRR